MKSIFFVSLCVVVLMVNFANSHMPKNVFRVNSAEKEVSLCSCDLQCTDKEGRKVAKKFEKVDLCSKLFPCSKKHPGACNCVDARCTYHNTFEVHLGNIPQYACYCSQDGCTRERGLALVHYMKKKHVTLDFKAPCKKWGYCYCRVMRP